MNTTRLTRGLALSAAAAFGAAGLWLGPASTASAASSTCHASDGAEDSWENRYRGGDD